MKKVLFVLILFITISAQAQSRLVSRSATIRFFSKAPMENIEAVNSNGISVIDKTTGQLEFSVLMKGFSFEKALMQEHFNENYVESDQFPKAVFKGKIENLQTVDFSKEGLYNTSVSGTLQFHGVTKPVATKVTLTVKNGVVTGETNFDILLEDYGIKIPALVKDKIAKNVRITVKAPYQNQ